MKISWVILTYNRRWISAKAFDHNLEQISKVTTPQIIHVDNGSTPGDIPELPSSVLIRFVENQGVAKGYNAGLAHATGDYILITGCDRLMPPDFLNKMLNVVSNSNVGIVSIYSRHVSECKERMEKNSSLIGVNGLVIHEGLPLEAKLIPMPLFKKIGYFHEGLGFYGWEDVLWAERAQKVAKENGLANYVLVDVVAQHLGSEGIQEYNGQDEREYHEFKRREATDPEKQKVCEAYRAAGHPYINPFV